MKTRKNIFIQPFNKLLKWLPVLGLLILATGLNSCEDFLTQNNPNQTSSDKFWSNLDDTNKGLTSTYAVLRNAYLVNTNIEAWRSDMGWPGYGRPTPTLGLENYNTWYAHGYTDSNDDISKKWEACYLGIFRAGQVIEALDRIKGTVNETELNLQMGQARFLRGLFYFYLYNAFNEGKVILHKTVPRTMEEFHKDVATAPEVFNFFMSDLKIAYQLLPAKFSTIDANLGRPSAGAAATILGTSYMYKNDIDSAMIYFNDVIGGKAESNRYGYALEDELDKMFTTKGEYNSESILEVSYTIKI